MKWLQNFFKLIRIQNLILVAFILLTFRYGFFKIQNVSLALSDFNYLLFVFSLLFLLAGAAIITTIVQAENENNNAIIGNYFSSSFAYYTYIISTSIGVGIGFYLCNYIDKPGLSSVFIILAVLFYFYATILKNWVLINSLAIASLFCICILSVGFFDILLSSDIKNTAVLSVLYKIILDYSIVSFIIILSKEFLSDIVSTISEKSNSVKTLSGIIGIEKTKIIILFLSLITLIAIGYYCYYYLFLNGLFYSIGYTFALIIAPLIYFIVTLLGAKKINEFRFLGTLLTLQIVLTLLSIVVISLEIKYHV